MRLARSVHHTIKESVYDQNDYYEITMNSNKPRIKDFISIQFGEYPNFGLNAKKVSHK